MKYFKSSSSYATVALFLGGNLESSIAFVPISANLANFGLKGAPKVPTCLSSSLAPRVSSSQFEELQEKGYLVISDFLPESLQSALRKDIKALRENAKFKVARIGQDSTNALNTDIRIAETCFLGDNKKRDLPQSSARTQLYQILDQLRQDLSLSTGVQMDANLSEFLYAYYPTGGFYRRHRDAVPGSASTLRKFSLLLYLNQNWTPEQAGQLRMHFDSGGDELPPDEKPNFQDVEPKGGTLVLFESDKVPHEVLDTKAERMAVVGWYNRPLAATDISELASEGVEMRMIMLAVAAGLITVGLASLI